MPFDDRRDAGCKLASALAKYKDQQPVVLALPRGGVPVAAEVAVGLGRDRRTAPDRPQGPARAARRASPPAA
jgi:predicted phosphoribosyltransferase